MQKQFDNTFQDIDYDSDLYNEIIYLGTRNVIDESIDTTFFPQHTITFAKFTEWALRANGYHYDEGIIDEQSWDNPYIKEALDKEVFAIRDGFKRATQPVTYEECAWILSNLIGKDGTIDYNTCEDVFNDVEEINPKYKDSVFDLSVRGIMISEMEDQFQPKELITREDAVSILYRYLNADARKPMTNNLEIMKGSMEIIGSTDVELNGVREVVRTSQTNLGTLIANALLTTTKADVAIMQGGGIRASIPKGNIMISNIFSVLPFDNYVVVIEVSGKKLIEALNVGYTNYPDLNNGFPHVAGVSYTVNTKALASSRILEVAIGGSGIDPERIYKVAVNDYLSTGGDGYETFVGCNIFKIYPTIAEVVIDYIKVNGIDKIDYATNPARIVK